MTRAFLLMLAGGVALLAQLPKTINNQCLGCHREATLKHASTPMYRALEPVAVCELLKANPLLEFKLGAFQYRIERKGDQSIYSVTDGKETLSYPIAYAFGLGAAGQTYIYEQQGNLYESRVSYYKKFDGLGVTIGAPPGLPKTLQEAAGRLMSKRDQAGCFGCHTVNAVQNDTIKLEGLIPGVQCDSCHGSSKAHVEGFKDKLVSMPKLARQTAEEQSEMCGKCHRTWADIAANGPRGIGNVRFQPYRLALSKCYDTEDRRIACTACHDPHASRASDVAAYDKACLACHRKGSTSLKAAARICKVKASDCASCHMPSYEIPGSHHEFVDHFIRIARPNEPYPN